MLSGKLLRNSLPSGLQVSNEQVELLVISIPVVFVRHSFHQFGNCKIYDIGDFSKVNVLFCRPPIVYLFCSK